jgi:hypothetical protein
MVSTKRAPVGIKEPVESTLNGVSDADTSKLDRSAMRTAHGEQPYYGVDHDSKTSAFAVLSAAGPASFWIDGLE